MAPVHAARSYDSRCGVDRTTEEVGLWKHTHTRPHLPVTGALGLLVFRIGAEKKNGNDFLHLRAQFTTEIAFHLNQAAADSTEHLNKIKQESFTF